MSRNPTETALAVEVGFLRKNPRYENRSLRSLGQDGNKETEIRVSRVFPGQVDSGGKVMRQTQDKYTTNSSPVTN